MNEYLYGTYKKKFCRKCGSKLIDETRVLGYNEYSGTPVKVIVKDVCPNQDEHNLKDKKFYGEDLDD